MKRLIFWIFWLLGLVALFRYLHRNSLTILLYHGVAPKSDVGIFNYRGKFIQPHHFEKQMRYFARHYNIISLDDAIAMLRDETLPRNALVITFDDGYGNFYHHVFPVLKKMNIPATMFLATDFVFHKTPLWVDRLEYAMGMAPGSKRERIAEDARVRDELKKMPNEQRERRLEETERRVGTTLIDFSAERSVYAPLTESEIREMHDAGITFGAHTKTHPILSQIPVLQLDEEIQGSKIEIHNCTHAVSRVFAYPNGGQGDWNDIVERKLSEAGFSAALTTLEGLNTRETNPFRLKRMVLDATDDSPAFAAIAAGVRLFLKSFKN